MAFPVTDSMGLRSSGLLEVHYQCNIFSICRVAQWAYMAVMVLEDTTDNEYIKTDMVSIAAWHIDHEFAIKIMENNKVFAASMLSKKTTREPDLAVTIYDRKNNELSKIRDEIISGKRQPIENPVLDRIFTYREAQRLRKTFVDVYGEHPQFSDRSAWLGILLVCLLPPVGFFYFRKYAFGIIMPVLVIASVIFGPLTIPMGLITAIFIFATINSVLTIKVRDGKGRIICTKKNKAFITESIEKYHRLMKELNKKQEDD